MSSKKKPESSESSESNDDTYEVEDIIADRYNRGTHEFRIRWLGFPPEADTWEPEASLDCPTILKAYMDKQRRRDERRKPKRSSKAKKRRASRSPSPDPAKVDEVSMDDVFDSAPKTPPELDFDEESDHTSIKVASKKNQSKEKPATPLIGSDKASSSKSKNARGDPGPSSSSSRSHKKRKSSKDNHKRGDSSNSSKAHKEKSTSPPKTSERSASSKKDKSGPDTALPETEKSTTKPTEKLTSAKDKTDETTKKSDAASHKNTTVSKDGSKTKSGSGHSSSAAKTVLPEKERSNKEIPVAQVLGQLLSNARKKSEANASNTPVHATVTSSEKEKSKDKSSSVNAPKKSVTPSSVVTSAEKAKTNVTDQAIPLATDPLSSTPPITSISHSRSASSASNVRINPEGKVKEVKIMLSKHVTLGISLLNRRPPSAHSGSSSAQPELVPISEILAKNPPIIKDELSELSGHFSSTSITLSSTDESGRKSSGTAQNISKSRQQYIHSGSSSSTPTVVNAAASDRPGSSRQSSRIEPTRAMPIVLEDPTRFQPPQPNVVIAMPPIVFEKAPERPFSSLEQPIRVSSTSSPTVNLHKCFEKDPTVFQYAQGILIHNVNCQKAGYVLAKLWKLRCPECTKKNLITDCTVEYVFCFFTVHSKHFLMIKLANRINELYCMETDQFRIACPMKYASFTALTREYFEGLGDLQMEIEEQKEIVHRSMQNGPLCIYLNGGTITNPEIFKLPIVIQTVREITKLFFMELTLAIGEFMCKQVDTSALYPFVMEYYENRDPMYTAVTKVGIEQNYEVMYTSLIPNPNPQP
uniref:Chromo domain-containing protein n=1 Tax=Panagrolaimus sp. ES5 TaxID=591445 RepID=A0AC34F820_9BILA